MSLVPDRETHTGLVRADRYTQMPAIRKQLFTTRSNMDYDSPLTSLFSPPFTL